MRQRCHEGDVLVVGACGKRYLQCTKSNSTLDVLMIIKVAFAEPGTAIAISCVNFRVVNLQVLQDAVL